MKHIHGCSVKPDHLQICNELHNLPGKITKKKTFNYAEARQYFNRSITQCPDETVYWLQFNEPITTPGNLFGWKGVWLPLDLIQTT